MQVASSGYLTSRELPKTAKSNFVAFFVLLGTASSFISEISSFSVTVANHPKAILLVTYTSLASLGGEKYTTIPRRGGGGGIHQDGGGG